MAINWTFDSSKVKQAFETAPEGDYQVKIESLIEKTSNSGYPMWEFKLKLPKNYGTVRYYIVFRAESESDIEMVNTNLSNLWESFKLGGVPRTVGINENFFVGKTGFVHINHREYNGNMYANVQYILTGNRTNEAVMLDDNGAASENMSMGGFPFDTPQF